MCRKCCPTGALRSFQAVGVVNRTRHRLDKVYIFGFSKGAFFERPSPCGAFKQMGLRNELDIGLTPLGLENGFAPWGAVGCFW